MGVKVCCPECGSTQLATNARVYWHPLWQDDEPGDGYWQITPESIHEYESIECISCNYIGFMDSFKTEDRRPVRLKDLL